MHTHRHCTFVAWTCLTTVGTIPSEIKHLSSSLTELHLQNNHLSGNRMYKTGAACVLCTLTTTTTKTTMIITWQGLSQLRLVTCCIFGTSAYRQTRWLVKIQQDHGFVTRWYTFFILLFHRICFEIWFCFRVVKKKGDIPSQIGNLTQLSMLFLNGNNLFTDGVS